MTPYSKVKSAFRGKKARKIYTYFFQEENSKHIKIGKSEAPLVRMGDISSRTHRSLVCLTTIPGDVEIDYHKRFRHLRICGEWFEPGFELLREIEELPPSEHSSILPVGYKLS